MHTLSAMISPSQRAQIKAEIAKLEEDRKICNEAGIRKVIEGWIEEQKKKLAEGMREDPYAGPAIFSMARPTERRRWGATHYWDTTHPQGCSILHSLRVYFRFKVAPNQNSKGTLKIKRSLDMKKIDFKVFMIATVFAFLLSVPLSARAQDAATIFKSKCVGCHAADGTGSAMGKKMGAHDFTSADVQGMSDVQLTDIITNGKNKMPKYASLKPEDIQGLVAYIRTLKK